MKSKKDSEEIRSICRLRWRNWNCLTLMVVATLVASCNAKEVREPKVGSPAVAEATHVVDRKSDLTADSTPKTPKKQKNKKTQKVKFKRGDGSVAFYLQAKNNGAKMVDGNNEELAQLAVDPKQRVKMKNAAGEVIGYIVPGNGYWTIENPKQTREMYILRRQDDGDYKLEDGKSGAIYRIKAHNYGLEIETPEKQSLYKIEVKDKKITLRDAEDKTVLSTESGFSAIAVACFGFEKLNKAQQAALAYAVNLSEGR